MDIKQFTVHQDVEGTFRFKGKLTIHDLEYLKEFIDTSLSKTKKISLSMEEVEYVDTASLQLIIAFRKTRGSGDDWTISKISPGLEKILEISDLKKAFV
ncbi:MAG: STAS domain-containing protein [Desulfobulbaceae bacterium]|nr:STAS domain-containing protein [Desulfobulbaceae bacterium]